MLTSVAETALRRHLSTGGRPRGSARGSGGGAAMAHSGQRPRGGAELIAALGAGAAVTASSWQAWLNLGPQRADDVDLAVRQLGLEPVELLSRQAFLRQRELPRLLQRVQRFRACRRHAGAPAEVEVFELAQAGQLPHAGIGNVG